MLTSTTTTDTPAAAAYRHQNAILKLCKAIGQDCDQSSATWADVGDLAYTRDLLTRAAYACCAITEGEARKMGVRL